MKHILPLICALSLFSCTKTKYVNVPVTVHDTDTVTVTHHDTTIINNTKATLLGQWYSPIYSNHNPTFDRETFTYGGITYRYLSSSDTIYARYSSGVIEVNFYYKLWPTNDTLELQLIAPLEQPKIKYYRVN